MKILIFTNNYKTIGGIQQYTKNFLRAMKELNQDFKIVMLKKSNVFYKIIFVLESFIKVIFYRPNFILCNHINFTPLAFFYKKIFNIDYGFIAHGIEVWGIKNKKLEISLKNSSKIICVSNYTRNIILNKYKLPEGVFNIIANTINSNEFKILAIDKNKILEKFNLPQNKKIILTICRLDKSEQYKGYDKVIKVLPEIIKIFNDVIYVIVGDGDDRERIENLIKDLNLDNYVYLLGRLSNQEKIEILNITDLFIMPSTGEGFGIVFLEALACGIPVIAGNKDASPEPLLNGRLGILVNPDNLEEIEDAIIKILSGQAPREFYDKEYLRNEVIKNFGFDKFKNDVKMILSRLSDIKLKLNK